HLSARGGDLLATAPETSDGSVAPHNFNWHADQFGPPYEQFSALLPRDGCSSFGDADREFQALTSSFEFGLLFSGTRRWLHYDQASLTKADIRLWRDLSPVVSRFARVQDREQLAHGFNPSMIGIDIDPLCQVLG